jgi:hypothetical protein
MPVIYASGACRPSPPPPCIVVRCVRPGCGHVVRALTHISAEASLSDHIAFLHWDHEPNRVEKA